METTEMTQKRVGVTGLTAKELAERLLDYPDDTIVKSVEFGYIDDYVVLIVPQTKAEKC